MSFNTQLLSTNGSEGTVEAEDWERALPGTVLIQLPFCSGSFGPKNTSIEPSSLIFANSVVFLQMHSGTNSTGRVTSATDNGAILNRAGYSAAIGMSIRPRLI
jgi:hypothetical protein